MKRRARGFTLVEATIVAAILVALVALSIYGVRRYLASAKTSEAKNSVGAISRVIAGAYERDSAAEQVRGEGVPTRRHLCGSAEPVPAWVPRGVAYQPSLVDGLDFQSGTATAGWKCLKFGMSQPIYYQYRYTNLGEDIMGDEGFEVSVTGDLDGDGSLHRIRRTGQLNATTHELRTSTQVEEVDPFE